MTLTRVIRLGTASIVGMYRDGTLPPEWRWTALRGAARYFRAILSGDVADDEEQHWRARVCLGCHHHSQRPLDGSSGVYCGPPFDDRLDAPEPTCGCLVALTTGGAVVPAGKVVVASEACPQGRWTSQDSATMLRD